MSDDDWETDADFQNEETDVDRLSEKRVHGSAADRHNAGIYTGQFPGGEGGDEPAIAQQ